MGLRGLGGMSGDTDVHGDTEGWGYEGLDTGKRLRELGKGYRIGTWIGGTWVNLMGEKIVEGGELMAENL
jgi:hypothetical protein